MKLYITASRTLFAPFFGAALALFLSGSAALSGQDVCKSDAQKFCANKTWDTGLQHCLTQHRSQISRLCDERIEAQEKIDSAKNKHDQKVASEKLEEVREECKPEINQFCKSSVDNSSQLLSCLHNNGSKLSEECREEVHETG